jgi:hypothetical protein
MHYLIYEGRLFVCFVCCVEISLTTNASCCTFGAIGKPLGFHNVLTYAEKVFEYRIKISLKIHLIQKIYV